MCWTRVHGLRSLGKHYRGRRCSHLRAYLSNFRHPCDMELTRRLLHTDDQFQEGWAARQSECAAAAFSRQATAGRFLFFDCRCHDVLHHARLRVQLMNAYAERQATDLDSIRFVFVSGLFCLRRPPGCRLQAPGCRVPRLPSAECRAADVAHRDDQPTVGTERCRQRRSQRSVIPSELPLSGLT